MKCPLCKTPSLDATVLAPDLEGCICGECNGVWIARTKYDAWRKRLPKDIPETASDAEFSVNDTRVAKICPQCGHLLLPYRVGHGCVLHRLLRRLRRVCVNRNEWDAIKARNLHDNLHDIVSAHWQNAVRRAMSMPPSNKPKRVLGDAYDKAAEVREWLRNEPRRSTLLAYLSDTQRPE